MRIAFVVGYFPVLSETFILNQVVGMIERGHEVDIFPIHPPLVDTSKVHPDVKKYDLLKRTYSIQKIPKNYLLRVLKGLGLLLTNCYKDPSVWLRSLNTSERGKQAASLRLLYQVIPLLGKGPYDIIHCQFGTLSHMLMSLRSLGALQGKLIVTFRGHDISEHIQQHGDDVYSQLFETGDFFLTNCDYFKRRLLKLGCDEKKVAVHRSGLDCSQFVFTPRRPRPDRLVRIATTGRLVEKKGIEYSIRAVAKLAQLNYKIEYKIVGDGPLREDLQQLIQELNVEDKVKLLGWKNQQEIIEILNASHIFVAPSVTAQSGDQDAPVNVLKEAMAMGLPVISTVHGGIPELVEDGISGFLVPERDANAIAQKLVYLIQHPVVWSEMGRAGRAYVEQHYDLNKLNDKLAKIYAAMIDSEVHQQRSQLQPMSPASSAL